MDVWINSLIQSPLVRTLARTKGKSQSFTFNIPDNVPPASFSKIVLDAQNAGDNRYGRNYKIKVPQYGYLRDAVLKFTVRENVIHPEVVNVVKELFNAGTTFTLDDIQVGGSYNAASTPGTSGTRTAMNLSWYNLQRGAVLNTGGATASFAAANIDRTAQDDCSILAPQFASLYGTKASEGTVQTGATGASARNGIDEVKFGDTGIGFDVPMTSLYSNSGSQTTTRVIGPASTAITLNGNPKLWSKVLSFYYNIYELAHNSKGYSLPSITFGSGSVTPTEYKVAKMIWDRLKNQPQYTTTVTIRPTATLVQTLGTEGGEGEVNQTLSTATTHATANSDVSVVLPPYITTISRGGRTFWVPRLPQLQVDGLGNVVGVDFVALSLIHPNDDATSFDKTQLSLLSSDTSNKEKNARKFEFADDDADRDEWNMWDWQTESQYYPGFAANVAERVTLSTHNKPIQTIFPQETFARIQRMSQSERYRYLKMMEPIVSQQGTCNGTDTAKNGEKVFYLPLFLSSTENCSYNFDTRFVEQLDIDVNVNAMDGVYVSTDIQKQEGVQNAIVGVSNWIGQYRDAVFAFGWTRSGTATASAVTTASGSVLYALEFTGAATVYPESFKVYSNYSPRNYALWLRTFDQVPANYVRVQALTFFHNFHDATAQAIRDSNFKPETPANLLQYNTYTETERLLTATELQRTQTIHIPITTNNLVFGTTVMVRRRSLGTSAGKRDHYFQTLPLQSLVLTASGQQIYQSVLDENVLTDCWDFDLATGKVGRKYNNAVSIQSRVDPLTGDTFYFYYIPYSFSSDMTYNSGSIAFQTLNNPILSLTVDVGDKASKPFDLIPQDNEWTIQVFHNYFNMLRIDSNTGAITRSLDL
jgi:hypothetical protein